MRIGKRLCHTRHDRQHLGHRQQIAILAIVQQVLALEELHGDVCQIVFFPGIEYGDDILVLQSTGGFGFAEKPLARIDQFVTRELLAQCHGLDGNDTADLRVFTQVDDTHGPLAKLLVHLISAQHRFLDCAAVQQHGSTRVGAAAAKHHGLGHVLGAIEFGLQVFVVLVISGHVLIDRLRLVELPLALEIQCQVIQVAHHGVVHRYAAKAVERHVELALALQRQAHHAVGLCRLLVRLQLAGLRHQEAFGGEGQMPDRQQGRRQHQFDPGCATRQEEKFSAQQSDKGDQRDNGRGTGRKPWQQGNYVSRHQQKHRHGGPYCPAWLHNEMLAQDA